MIIDELINEFKKRNEVDAIAIGGSRSNDSFDSKSDFDVYVYLNSDFSEAVRKKILSKYCKKIEISNQYWEKEDNCIMNDDIDLDIIYRKINDVDISLKRTVEKHMASNGYTTCLWYNIMTSRIIIDKENKLRNLVEKYNVAYPEELRVNIIKKNMNLLSGVLPSYDEQIKKAYNRRDLISINHRISEFLASYFDIIFALNNKLHPGEKRLISLSMKHCEKLPKDFESSLNNLLVNLYTDSLIDNLNIVIRNISDLIEKESI